MIKHKYYIRLIIATSVRVANTRVGEHLVLAGKLKMNSPNFMEGLG